MKRRKRRTFRPFWFLVNQPEMPVRRPRYIRNDNHWMKNDPEIPEEKTEEELEPELEEA